MVRNPIYRPNLDEPFKELTIEESQELANIIIRLKEKRAEELKETIEDEEYWANVRIDYHIPEHKLTTTKERCKWLGYTVVEEEEEDD